MEMHRKTKKCAVTVTRDDVNLLSAKALGLQPHEIEPYAKLRAALRECHSASGPGTKAVKATLIGLPRPLLKRVISELEAA